MADSSDLLDRLRRGGHPTGAPQLFSRVSPVIILDDVNKWWENNTQRIIPFNCGGVEITAAEFAVCQVFPPTGFMMLVQSLWASASGGNHTMTMYVQPTLSGANIDETEEAQPGDTRLPSPSANPFAFDAPMCQVGANAGAVRNGATYYWKAGLAQTSKMEVDVLLQNSAVALVVETQSATTDAHFFAFKGLLFPQDFLK
jgi:hypothetical protein